MKTQGKRVISALVLLSWARKIRRPGPEGPARQTISVQKTDVPPQSDEPGIGKILELNDRDPGDSRALPSTEPTPLHGLPEGHPADSRCALSGPRRRAP